MRKRLRITIKTACGWLRCRLTASGKRDRLRNHNLSLEEDIMLRIRRVLLSSCFVLGLIAVFAAAFPDSAWCTTGECDLMKPLNAGCTLTGDMHCGEFCLKWLAE